MNNTKPDAHRVFSQQDFAESLQALDQLSTQATEIQNPEITNLHGDISWDDAAADVENFLQHSTHPSTPEKSG